MYCRVKVKLSVSTPEAWSSLAVQVIKALNVADYAPSIVIPVVRSIVMPIGAGLQARVWESPVFLSIRVGIVVL